VRFSLRTILLAFVLVGLALATVMSALKMWEAEAESKRVRRAYGLGGPHRYRLTYLGPMASSVKDSVGIHLVRVDDPDDYVIQVFLYDRDGLKSLVETIEFPAVDLEFAIWKTLNHTMTVESLRVPEMSWEIRSALTKEEEVYSYPYEGAEGEIKPGPFLTYFFCPPKVMNETNFQQTALDEAKLKAWCQKYQTESIRFEFIHVPQQ
jgi:hypothetical protein